MEVQQRIILATIELMSKNGVKRTTMDEVAQHLSISKRTIYEKFEDKVALISAVIKYFYTLRKKEADKIKKMHDNIIEQLFETLKFMEKHFVINSRIINDVERHYPDIYQKECMPQYTILFHNMVNGLEDGVKQGILMPNTNCKFTVLFIMESINAMLINIEKVNSIANVSAFETVRLIFLNTFRGISTKNGIELIDKIIKEQKITFTKS